MASARVSRPSATEMNRAVLPFLTSDVSVCLQFKVIRHICGVSLAGSRLRRQRGVKSTIH